MNGVVVDPFCDHIGKGRPRVLIHHNQDRLKSIFRIKGFLQCLSAEPHLCTCGRPARGESLPWTFQRHSGHTTNETADGSSCDPYTLALRPDLGCARIWFYAGVFLWWLAKRGSIRCWVTFLAAQVASRWFRLLPVPAASTPHASFEALWFWCTLGPVAPYVHSCLRSDTAHLDRSQPTFPLWPQGPTIKLKNSLYRIRHTLPKIPDHPRS